MFFLLSSLKALRKSSCGPYSDSNVRTNQIHRFFLVAGLEAGSGAASLTD